MQVAEALVRILVKEGITDAFGIPGAGINPVYKYLKAAPISHYCMRHEKACTHAADGYYRGCHRMKAAQGYGCLAERVFTPGELASALERAKESGRTYVIDAVCKKDQFCDMGGNLAAIKCCAPGE